jgi:hypothetical protein
VITATLTIVIVGILPLAANHAMASYSNPQTSTLFYNELLWQSFLRIYFSQFSMTLLRRSLVISYPQKKDKVNLLTIDIVWSYFQDKFPTTHYDLVLGGNGSGKSSYGISFGATGYHVVNLTSPNAANINRMLGCIEVGQCTIISDETGALNKNEDLMSLLKNGYDSKGKTSKINDFSREPEFSMLIFSK